MNFAHTKTSYDSYLKAYPFDRDRWFSSDLVQADFEMIRSFLMWFIVGIKKSSPHTYLEFGPETGTLTEVFASTWRKTQFELIESSEEMSSYCHSRFRANAHVQVSTTDFLHYTPGKTYDFFFSSHEFGQHSNVVKVIQHINLLLNWEGEGLVIVTVPVSSRWPFGSSQSTTTLSDLLVKGGMKILGTYPVTFAFPFMTSARVNLLLSYFFRRFKYMSLLALCTTSYAIYFKKA